MPTLKELFALFGKEAPEVPVRGLTLDSRRVEPGFVFVAVPGVPLPHRKPLDGHDFVPEALARGAVAVVLLPLDPVTPTRRSFRSGSPWKRRARRARAWRPSATWR